MSAINYDYLSDSEKLDLLRVLYHDLKHKEKNGQSLARDIEQKALILAETQIVYSRLRRHSH